MAHYDVSRMITVAAEPARVRSLIEDLHAWTQWSPWEGRDPAMERTYSGPASGVGSRYAWSGNRKAGAGTMTVTEVGDGEVGVDVEFTKPFKSRSHSAFELVPAGPATAVTWRMTGEQKGLAALFGKIVPMDKLVGKDFERGLAQLKTVAESPGQT